MPLPILLPVGRVPLPCRGTASLVIETGFHIGFQTVSLCFPNLHEVILILPNNICKLAAEHC